MIPACDANRSCRRQITDSGYNRDPSRATRRKASPCLSWAKAFGTRKLFHFLKNPGEQMQLDDDLCEVETDKAVYPIQSSFAGVMGEWKTKVGDTVEIGQELGHDCYDRAGVCGTV